MQIILENLRPTRAGHFGLLPNINVSGRTLPAKVSEQDLSRNDKLDNERPTRKLTDKEIYSFRVVLSDQEWKNNPKLALEVTFTPSLFKLFNQSGLPLPSQNNPPVVIDLQEARKNSTKTGSLQFFIEAQTFRGSPMIDPKAGQQVAFRVLDEKGTVLLLQSLWNKSEIRTSELILVGDDAAPERIFMCELEDNQPSVRELIEGVKKAGVSLTLVPQQIGRGDTWLQDQFQMAYTRSPEGMLGIILHLPRMVNDSALFAGSPNLRNFVDTYFPSKSIGVVKDFWRLTTTVEDTKAPSTSLEVAQSYTLYKQLLLAVSLLQSMFRLAKEIDPKSHPHVANDDLFDLYEVRKEIDTLRAKLMSSTKLTKEQSDRILGFKTRIDKISQVLGRKGDTVTLSVSVNMQTQKYVYDSKNKYYLRKLFMELNNIHNSRNFGGNIEISPPYQGAPYGKILAGSISSTQLREFLTSRGQVHPYAEVFTDWLDVGHIDEIAAFAARGEGNFAILRTSPKLALEILDRLVDWQVKNNVPVTRFFRGKKWMHESAAGATDNHPPPDSYQRLLKSYDLSGLERKIPKQTKPSFGDAAYHDDRQFLVLNKLLNVKVQYSAMISCADLRAICRETNLAVENLFLADTSTYATDPRYRAYLDNETFRKEVVRRRLDRVLSKEFPGIRVYPVPGLFDYTREFLHSSTSAIIPSAINLQTLGAHVLVPRPCAARMPVSEAVAFTNSLLAQPGHPKTKVDENYIRSRGLDKTWHWTRPTEYIYRAELRNMPTEFDSDYQEYQLELQREAQVEPWYRTTDSYTLKHQNDPLTNHPAPETENLYRIAGYFKDGFPQFKNFPVDFCKGDTEGAHPKFDKYQSDIKAVMDQINRANPGVFDSNGDIDSEDWVRIRIPEDTVDVFELYTQVLLESLGLKVHWIDSWYYHAHLGGIHCATNVLRSFVAKN